MADGLKEVYQAVTVEEAERQLAKFEEAWAESYPVIAGSWRQNWARVVRVFAYPREIRRAIYFAILFDGRVPSGGLDQSSLTQNA